jgi:4-hydroxy-2-oxoheptanedioate aldolase
MKPNKLKKKILSGQPVFGSFILIPEASIVEVLAYAGFDFAVLDLEHTTYDIKDVTTLIRAAEANEITPIVRIGEKNYYSISRVLDAGAQGVMIPHIMDAKDAKKMIEITKYPPLGTRPSCTGVRANQYASSNFLQHVQQSNENLLFMALIEDISAVDKINQILEVPGIDVVIPGPGDLSTSMNIPGGFEHPSVIGKIEKVLHSTVKKKSVCAGMYVSAVEQAARWLKLGAKVILYSMDVRVVLNAYCDALSKLKNYLS